MTDGQTHTDGMRTINWETKKTKNDCGDPVDVIIRATEPRIAQAQSTAGEGAVPIQDEIVFAIEKICLHLHLGFYLYLCITNTVGMCSYF